MKATAFALAAAGAASAAVTPSYPAGCPDVGTSGPDGRYSCNPAHHYPEGQICEEDSGCYYLRHEAPGIYATPAASYSVDVPEYETPAPYPYSSVDVPEYHTPSPYPSHEVPEYHTSTLIVPCPTPTVYVHTMSVPTHKASTYTVKTATTLTIPVTYVVPPKTMETHPAPPKMPEVYPFQPPKAPETHPVAPPPKSPETYPAAPPATAPAPPVYKPTAPAGGNTTKPYSPATYTGAAAQQTAGAILAVAAMGALFL